MMQKIFNMMGQSKFFEDFTVDDVEKLTSFMQAYEVEAGTTIIREGDVDDYMLFIIEGRVNILKTDSHGERRPMTIAGPGTTLGEMSMIDGNLASQPVLLLMLQLLQYFPGTAWSRSSWKNPVSVPRY